MTQANNFHKRFRWFLRWLVQFMISPNIIRVFKSRELKRLRCKVCKGTVRNTCSKKCTTKTWGSNWQHGKWALLSTWHVLRNKFPYNIQWTWTCQLNYVTTLTDFGHRSSWLITVWFVNHIQVIISLKPRYMTMFNIFKAKFNLNTLK